MRTISTYIIEKLNLNDKEKFDYNEHEYWNARRFQKDNILYTNPNISRGPKNPGRPGLPAFYKVTDIGKNKIKIAPIGDKLVNGDRKKGEYMPDDSRIYKDCWLKIDDDGFIYYGGNVVYLWDGTPEKFYNN